MRAARGWSARGGADRGGARGPLFAGLEEPLVSLQWHGDTFELPDGATLLARSAEVAHQAFRVGERAYGVQFHLEVTAEMAREWAAIPAYADSLAATLGERRGAEFIADVGRRAGELHPPARRMFGNWLELAGSAAEAGPGDVHIVLCTILSIREWSSEIGR